MGVYIRKFIFKMYYNYLFIIIYLNQAYYFLSYVCKYMYE